jgi:hypothetical protein
MASVICISLKNAFGKYVYSTGVHPSILPICMRLTDIFLTQLQQLLPCPLSYPMSTSFMSHPSAQLHISCFCLYETKQQPIMPTSSDPYSLLANVAWIPYKKLNLLNQICQVCNNCKIYLDLRLHFWIYTFRAPVTWHKGMKLLFKKTMDLCYKNLFSTANIMFFIVQYLIICTKKPAK